MEFVFWYVVIGAVVTAVHLLIIKVDTPWAQFDLVGTLITVLVWPLLFIHYLSKLFQR